jgi:hypothetical protein
MRYLLILSVLVLIIRCSNKGLESPQKIDFSNEQVFKKALEGSWILKAYVDSINKALTPYYIQDLLHGIYGFQYNPHKNYSFKDTIDSSYYCFIDLWKNIPKIVESDSINTIDSIGSLNEGYFDEEGFSIRFNLAVDSCYIIKEDFSNNYDIKTGKWYITKNAPDTFATLCISISNTDTLVIIHKRKSVNKQDIVLIKSLGVDKLINKKYISGSYYLYSNSDSEIITFTDDGKVTGIGNVSKYFSAADLYYIEFSKYSFDNGGIVFMNSKTEHCLFPETFWTRIKDTLILTIDSADKKIIYKLIKK